MFKPPRKLAIAEACLFCELTDGRETSRSDDRSRDPRNDVDRLRTTLAAHQPALRGADAAHNAAAMTRVLRNEEQGAHRDALVLSAALALEVAGRADGPRECSLAMR